MKTLSDFDVRDKRVIVRLDLNSDIRQGKLIPSDRLTSSLETIKELQKKKCKIVLLAHQGRPDTKFHDFISLKQHAKALSKYIKIRFIPDVIGIKAIKAIATMKPGEVILLDNIRFVADELNYQKGKPNKLITQLAPLFDLYVNDAFSASHREHASIVGFPRVLPSVIGKSFEHELENVSKLKVSNALFILGGSKPEDNVKLLKKGNKVLASGLFGPFCIMSLGKNLGKQNKIMALDLKKYSSIIKQNKSKITMPKDLAIEFKGKRRDMRIEKFPVNSEIMDLGIETLEHYVELISKAKVIFFKGLAGLCNKPEFMIGTKALLLALSESKAFTVISGGHTITMLEKFKIPKSRFGYVSTSGGALIHYLANGTLPGIEALK